MCKRDASYRAAVDYDRLPYSEKIARLNAAKHGKALIPTFVERLYRVRGQPLSPIVAQLGVADLLVLQGAGVVVAQHREHELAAKRVDEQVGDVLDGHYAMGRVHDFGRHGVSVTKARRFSISRGAW